MIKVRTLNPIVISMVKRDIPLMHAGARMSINMTNLRIWITITSAISKVIRHMNVELEPCMHQDLKATGTIVRNMDIEPLNVDQSL